jgi:hypothetical protein
MVDWKTQIGEHPFFVVIIGDVRQGKTATACSIIDAYKGDATPYVVAQRGVYENYPDFFKRIDPGSTFVPNDAIYFTDDAHLFAHARDWMRGTSRHWEILAKERHHLNTSFILTTQQSSVVDRNLLNNISALIIKKPSFTQARFDRGEIRGFIGKADRALEVDDVDKAYIVSNESREEGVITGIKLPSWFSDDISKGYKDYFKMKSITETRTSGVHMVARVLRGLGRAFG